MFEKEAKEYVEKDGTECERFLDKMGFSLTCTSEQASILIEAIKQAFKDGAEFGYNKANEWHFPSKGEYPKEYADF